MFIKLCFQLMKNVAINNNNNGHLNYTLLPAVNIDPQKSIFSRIAEPLTLNL